MNPAVGRASGRSAEETQAAIERFLKASQKPALLEPGEELLYLAEDNFALELRNSRLTLQAWNEKRNLVRRVIEIREESRGRIELRVERFARTPGQVFLIDLARPSSRDWQRRGARLVFRERFRLFLTRQFPGWKLAEVSAEANLEHSLSPVYPRALLRKGPSGWAAIAAPHDSDADGILSFGLIWLDYLRRREKRLAIEGLALLVPCGQERTTGFRLPFLNPAAARYELFAYSEQDYAARVDPRDCGNLETRVRSPRERQHPLFQQLPEAWLESQVRANIRMLDAGLVPCPVYGQVPAFAGGERGVMDLLAVDTSGRLAVLELKATADLHLPLQALDYWMRVKWYLDRDEFAANGYFPGIALRPEAPRLLLISPALEFHPTTEAILGYFAPGVDVERIGLGVEWRKRLRVMFRFRGARQPLEEISNVP
jgi:hypothetical protein